MATDQLRAASLYSLLRQTTLNLEQVVGAVYKIFDVGQNVVQIIEDATNSRSEGFVTEWAKFKSTYVELVWRSRTVCTKGQSDFTDFLAVLDRIKNVSMSFDDKKAAVDQFLKIPRTTAEDAQRLSQDFKDLERDLNAWKQRLDERLKNCQWGTAVMLAAYFALLVALYALQQYLNKQGLLNEKFGDKDFDGLRKVWLHDTMSPVVTLIKELEEQWTDIWYEARLTFQGIQNARDSATATGLIQRLTQAEKSYRDLVESLRTYADAIDRSEVGAAHR